MLIPRVTAVPVEIQSFPVEETSHLLDYHPELGAAQLSPDAKQ